MVYTGSSLELGSIVCTRDISALIHQHKSLCPSGKGAELGTPDQAQVYRDCSGDFPASVGGEAETGCFWAAEDRAESTPTLAGCQTRSCRAALPQPAKRGDPFPTTQS